MKTCIICKDPLDDSAIRCSKCGALQPKAGITLPARPAKYAIQVFPKNWTQGSPAHALLFDIRDMHELVLETSNETARDAGALLIGTDGMETFDLFKRRRGWKKLKDLPMSQLAATFRLERSIPYTSMKWVGLKQAPGGLLLVISLRSARFRIYAMGWASAAPQTDELVSDLKSIFGKNLVSAEEVEIPDDKIDD